MTISLLWELFCQPLEWVLAAMFVLCHPVHRAILQIRPISQCLPWKVGWRICSESNSRKLRFRKAPQVIEALLTYLEEVQAWVFDLTFSSLLHSSSHFVNLSLGTLKAETFPWPFFFIMIITIMMWTGILGAVLTIQNTSNTTDPITSKENTAAQD